jgi:adenylosuccinate lyase
MISRYTPPDFELLWSDANRYRTWLEVELAACEAMEHHSVVPSGTTASIRTKAIAIDVKRIDDIERRTRHDLIAFLTHVEELVGDDARWLHRGMTSSDVLDTSFALLLVQATDAIRTRLQSLIDVLDKRATEYTLTPMIGRSHGIHAEPTTFGIALAGHLAELKRARERLQIARREIAVGKIAGAVGTYAYLSPEIEAHTLFILGLSAETVSTQIVARDRHAAYFSALALIAASIERLATNVRHWQRTEVGEAEEAFFGEQRGSSAMPHKRNPISSENLCGLARMMRAYASPALENVALWHERDISHSSVERTIAPDATTTLAFMLDRTTSLVEGLLVHPDRLKENLERTGGLYFSEAILLALVDKGIRRQDAHVIVQRNATKSMAGSGTFRENIENDTEVLSVISRAEVGQAFDLEHTLRYAEEIVARARR